jgi:protein-S-isoprenylcysteine O-methyltransferase Ste14
MIRAGGMFLLVRAIVYAALFIGLLLVFLPARLLSATGIAAPPSFGPWQAAGSIVGAAGGGIAMWCIVTFVFVGRGTQAPFDPPRRLVTAGPYGIIRNPMYTGATLTLAGAALFYRSLILFGYAAAFLLGTHLFVILYEEPTLRRLFGDQYQAYVQRTGRWWPKFGAGA